MQTITFDFDETISRKGRSVIDADIRFSFKPFITRLLRRVQTGKTEKINVCKGLLLQLEASPELMYPIEEKDISKYHHHLGSLYTALSPVLNDESEEIWAIGNPVYPCFYYGTDAFYQVFMDLETHRLKPGLSLPASQEMENTMLLNFYTVILKQFYDISIVATDYLIKSIVDQQTHLLKYYRLNVDTRFLEVKCKIDLPPLTLSVAREYMKDEGNRLEMLRNLLPPDIFEIEGMSILTLTDITAESTLESIKNAIIEHHKYGLEWDIKGIAIALKSLVGTDLMDFRLIPYIRLNDKNMVYSYMGFESVLLEQARRNKIPEEAYGPRIDSFLTSPQRMIFPEINPGEYTEHPMLELLTDKGIRSYALYPLFYNARLIGCLEMFSEDVAAFNTNTLARIEAAFPVLAQLCQSIITEFDNKITAVVTEKFTALQPSVAWRFYLAAYRHLASGAKEKGLPIEPIHFKDIYPFYGAVDIRNSSIVRNFENRNNYESSLRMINQAISLHLDDFNTRNQQVYPSYFEKFRTDGIEFDIYLGHSIAPNVDFSDEIVKDIRYRQLKVIAEIARTTNALKANLPLSLETTQLVFVYEKQIDISFRPDEQRFDVEGSYNIRYQMIKKRLDKAHIKGSTERLTQPGKIAIVYFSSSQAQEYLPYIQKLQEMHLLTSEVEYLEIEDLQGVEGLKALRVEVSFNQIPA